MFDKEHLIFFQIFSLKKRRKKKQCCPTMCNKRRGNNTVCQSWLLTATRHNTLQNKALFLYRFISQGENLIQWLELHNIQNMQKQQCTLFLCKSLKRLNHGPLQCYLVAGMGVAMFGFHGEIQLRRIRDDYTLLWLKYFQCSVTASESHSYLFKNQSKQSHD